MPPRKRATKQVVSPDAMFAELSSKLRKQAKEPNIYAYRPHSKQEKFHRSEAKKRLYIGGNRSGKTTSGVAEDIFWLRGSHPFKPVPEAPIFGRVIGVDFLRGVYGILIPQFKRWLPPSLLIDGSWDRSFSNETRTLSLTNGSQLEFMSYEQDTDKFAGVPRHFTHYDEEPPRHIYDECQARLIDYNGSAWFTMTPVEGMTWVYDSLYLPGTEDPENSGIYVIEADMLDNPHISHEAAEEFLRNLDADARDARQKGQFVQLGGLVFKTFNPKLHVVPQFVPPKSWEWYASVDHGYNNPTAWLWHAVSPDGSAVTFAEHYKNEMIVSEHARVFHERNAGFGHIPDIIVGDPAMQQRQGVTGTSIQVEYGDHGVYIMPGNNDVLIGVNQMQDYLTINPATGKPYWQITENCHNLIREMKRLRWKTWAGRKAQYDNNAHEQIHKKDDHATDSARYFFTCLPDLKPTIEENEKKKNLAPTATTRYDEVLAETAAASAGAGWKIYEGTDLYALESD